MFIGCKFKLKKDLQHNHFQSLNEDSLKENVKKKWFENRIVLVRRI